MANHLSSLRRIHTGNQAQQGGFTRAVGADQAHADALGDGQVDVLKHPVAAVVVVVALVEIADFDH